MWALTVLTTAVAIPLGLRRSFIRFKAHRPDLFKSQDVRPAVARPKIERAELIDISLPPQVREAHIQDLKDAWRTIFHTEPSKLEATTTTTGDTTPTRGGFEDKISIEESAAILGLTMDDADDEKKVSAAHRRVILRNHPDRGGSPFLATKINEAKEKLAKMTPEERARATRAQAQKKEAEAAKEKEKEDEKEEENATEGEPSADKKPEAPKKKKKKKERESLF